MASMTEQLDLFAPSTAAPVALSAAARREFEHFGIMDARTGLPLRGPESFASRITGEKRAVYETAFRAERERMLNENYQGDSGFPAGTSTDLQRGEIR